MEKSILNNEVSKKPMHAKVLISVYKKDVEKILEFIELLKKDEIFKLKNEAKYNSLTIREKEVFILVNKSFSSRQIGELLFIAPCTVESHRKNIIKKLNIDSRRDWMRFYRIFHTSKIPEIGD